MDIYKPPIKDNDYDINRVSKYDKNGLQQNPENTIKTSQHEFGVTRLL